MKQYSKVPSYFQAKFAFVAILVLAVPAICMIPASPLWKIIVLTVVITLLDGGLLILLLYKQLQRADLWWASLPFVTLERITGLHETDYAAEDGSQDFVEACDRWWNDRTIREKLRIWKQNFNLE